jgi:hypothetical protein
MKRLILSLGAAALVTLVVAGVAVGVGPRAVGAHQGQAGDADPVAAILGLSQTQIDDLRHDGLSLAQIAERQKVDPQKLVDALKAQWAERIDARLANGAISAGTAATLKTQLETRARDMVYKVTLGGMQGAAVGAGPSGSGAGASADGTTSRARNGAGVRAANGTGIHAGSGRGFGRP